MVLGKKNANSKAKVDQVSWQIMGLWHDLEVKFLGIRVKEDG